MDRLTEALGLEHLLESADKLAAGWGISHPAMGLLRAVDDFDRASLSGDVVERDDVLIGLARCASAAGENCPEAAAVLCHLVVPGTLVKLQSSRPASVSMGALSSVAASHLWIAARTFDWQSRRKVAATIQWQVRRATYADLGIVARDRGDRAWARTTLPGDEVLDLHVERLRGTAQLDPEVEVSEVLGDALQFGVVSSEDVELLRTVLHVSRLLPRQRTLTHGLMSAATSAQVARSYDMSPSTARRRFARVLGKLQTAQADGLLMMPAA